MLSTVTLNPGYFVTENTAYGSDCSVSDKISFVWDVGIGTGTIENIKEKLTFVIVITLLLQIVLGCGYQVITKEQWL